MDKVFFMRIVATGFVLAMSACLGFLLTNIETGPSKRVERALRVTAIVATGMILFGVISLVWTSSWKG